MSALLRFIIIFATIFLLLAYPVKAQSFAGGSLSSSSGLDSSELDSLVRLRSAPPRFDILRAREDYRYLAEGSIRDDFFRSDQIHSPRVGRHQLSNPWWRDSPAVPVIYKRRLGGVAGGYRGS